MKKFLFTVLFHGGACVILDVAAIVLFWRVDWKAGAAYICVCLGSFASREGTQAAKESLGVFRDIREIMKGGDK